MPEYLAHIAQDGREQTALAHLQGTAERCAAAAAAFGAEEQGRLAGLLHDVGKYSEAFQKRLHGGPRVDHATAGAFECWKLGQYLAAIAILGHHGGLPDGGGRGDGPDRATLCGRLNRARLGKIPDYGAWKRELSMPQASLPEDLRDGPAMMFFTRMLYSCLVDADYTDTGAFLEGAPADAEEKASMEALLEHLQRYISGWFPPRGALNERRYAILSRCLAEGACRVPGLYTLTVPTGGGKTVASLAFALAHARAQGLRRVVYVIPYTSIIEQTAEVFRDILGPENVLEHHSGVWFAAEEGGELTPADQARIRAAETWDAPVVVTTAVQFFESLFSCKPSQCRKLHNLAQSVLIFDEAQMLPLPYLRPCVWAMAQLAERYGATVLLCTATQPALGSLFHEFAPNLLVKELCPLPAADWDAFRRVTFRRAGKLTWEALAGQLQAKDQVLCVVNTRKAAQTVFRKLSGEGNFHLSTLMCPAHRKAMLAEIRRRLQAGLPCRVVSTSLIEAGVDVDFPAVYREEAGLDSILQAAGRCNREGRRAPEDSVVTIFQGEDAPPKLFATAIGAGRLTLGRFADIASREAVAAYFRDLLDLSGQQAQDREGILAKMKWEFFPFREVSDRFHLIDSPTVTVYVPWGEGAELLERLRAGECSRALYRRLGQYGVSAYPDHVRALHGAGALEPLEDGSFALRDLELYDEATGLSREAEGGQANFI